MGYPTPIRTFFSRGPWISKWGAFTHLDPATSRVLILFVATFGLLLFFHAVVIFKEFEKIEHKKHTRVSPVRTRPGDSGDGSPIVDPLDPAGRPHVDVQSRRRRRGLPTQVCEPPVSSVSRHVASAVSVFQRWDDCHSFFVFSFLNK